MDGLRIRGYELRMFPQEGLIVTFTGWDILPNSPGKEPVGSNTLSRVAHQRFEAWGDMHGPNR